jgi:tetrahydromethanopterin S-methyltransferase subunit B
MKNALSLLSITIYVTGLLIGSLFGFVAGTASLIAFIFAVKFFRHYKQPSEEPSLINA